uniref:Uncharacterized protein n=1 Tax=Caenorhabditis japonica TaxID=281687 RepID=A0A8R1IQ32_CAEJA
MDPIHVPSVSDPFWHYLPPPVHPSLLAEATAKVAVKKMGEREAQNVVEKPRIFRPKIFRLGGISADNHYDIRVQDVRKYLRNDGLYLDNQQARQRQWQWVYPPLDSYAIDTLAAADIPPLPVWVSF